MTWRLIEFAAHDGATNMALDEAILEAHLQGLVPPTLRLYGFSPPAVSLGQNQALPDGLMARANQRGVDVVRRPSGGRAVLHLADLTYSFVGTEKTKEIETPGGQGGWCSVLSPSVSKAYRQICAGLQAAFLKFDLELEIGASDGSYRGLQDCFRATTGSDLHFQGLKMVGSAQLRRRHAVLQHGSILLNQESSLMPELLGEADTKNDHPRHANFFEAVGDEVSLADLQNALKAGFEESFSVQLQKSELSDYELSLADSLRSKYRI